MYNTKRDIMKETQEFLNDIFKKNEAVVVACSGGPDSLCLLHLILNLKNKLNLRVICAHVNHQVRKESAKEELFVQDFCQENDLIFESMRLDFSNDAFSEQNARIKRYTFLESIVKKYRAKYLMTAHHGDDLIETILMRIVRGSNLKGYLGIKKINYKDGYNLVRPLLNVTKEDIYKYLEKNNLKYVIDMSNDDEKYTRNRYRKHMLPFLKKEDKNVHLKFLQYSLELEEYSEYISSIIRNKIADIYIDGKIQIDKFLEEDEFIQKRLLEYVISKIQQADTLMINNEQVKEIFKLLKSKDNKKINLADGYIARVSYNSLIIEKIDKKVNNNYEYVFDKQINILNKYRIKAVKNTLEKSNNVIRLSSEEIALPLVIRNVQQNDKMLVKNMNGTKKVMDILKDCKIDIYERWQYPVVVDSKNRLIWVPGLKKSIFDKEISEKYDIILKYMEEKK